MGKLWDFVKSHPALIGVVVVGVLVVMFWPSGGGGNSGASDSAVAATAVAASQRAATDLALSHDQVQALGLQAAAASAMNASNNAAAVSIASLEAGVSTATVNAGLAAQKSKDETAITLGQQLTQTEALKAIAGVIPKTQAQAIAGKRQTDAAGFGLLEMFKNLLNANQGVKATVTMLNTTNTGTAATVYGPDGKVIGSNYQASMGKGWTVGSKDPGKAGNVYSGKQVLR